MKLRPNTETFFTQADVQKERNILVGVVLDNRRRISSLKQIEKDLDKGQAPQNMIEGADSGMAFDDGATKNECDLDLAKGTESGGMSPFRSWNRDSRRHASTDALLFPKAAKDSATDTTCKNTLSFDGNDKTQKDKITIKALDAERSAVFGQKQGDRAEEINAESDSDWEGFNAATTDRKRKEKEKDLFDGVSDYFPDATFGNIQTAADDSGVASGIGSSKDSKGKGRIKQKEQRQKEMKNAERRSLEASPDPNVSVVSASLPEHAVEVIEVSKADSSDNRPNLLNDSPQWGQVNWSEDLPSASKYQENSLSQSQASDYHSIAPEIPITDSTEKSHSEEDLVIKNCKPQATASGKGIAAQFSKSQQSRPEAEMSTPTAQWFLSVVPHEWNNSALIVRPRSGEAKNLRARAEETAKTLLLNWTNVDPDVISGEENIGGWNATGNSKSHPAGDVQFGDQLYKTPYTPQPYPTYALQQWYRPPFYSLPPPPAVLTPSLPPNETQTDTQELARLKKLILEEKAEQDMREVAVAAATPSTATLAPIAKDQLLENGVRSGDSYMEIVEPTQTPQEHNTLWKTESPRLQPVMMRDWLGRKFIFPVDMCQTWKVSNPQVYPRISH